MLLIRNAATMVAYGFALLKPMPSFAKTCLDDPSYTFASTDKNGKPKDFKCLAIGSNEKLRQDLCLISEVRGACPLTCGLCCEDDPIFLFNTLNKNDKRVRQNCAWITKKKEAIEERREQQCILKKIAKKCRLACDLCKEPVVSSRYSKQRVGNWLPVNSEEMDLYIHFLREASLEQMALGAVLVEPIQRLSDMVALDPVMMQHANLMFSTTAHQRTPLGTPAAQTFNQFLHMVNIIMTTSPAFYTNLKDEAAGLVACPINAILDYPMSTKSGYAFFSNALVNQQLKKILSYWSQYLNSKDSRYVLVSNVTHPVLKAPRLPWFSEPAIKQMLEVAFHWTGNPVPTDTRFQDFFDCDSREEYFNFTSWDSFFTRGIRTEQRPIGNLPKPPISGWPTDPTSPEIVLNACESAPFRIVHNASLDDTFWAKKQPYSLQNILNFDENASKFVNGTVYQAFLSALSYHRWHSPVDGTVVKTEVVNGAYYSESAYEGYLSPDGPDTSSPILSMPYITAVATRAIIWIQAEEPIGLMAFVAVGMVEVSSCDITVKVGDTIKKGNETGMFHFGGSTHLLLFRQGLNVEFVDFNHQYNTEVWVNATNVPVKAQLARVTKKNDPN